MTALGGQERSDPGKSLGGQERSDPGKSLGAFNLRNVPLLSRVGADRADALRTDVDAAMAGWSDALLLRVDRRNQVLISDGRVVLGDAAKLADKPPEDAVFLGRIGDGRHVWAIRAALEGTEDPDPH